MNRRNFLKSIPALLVGLHTKLNITPIFTEPVDIGPIGEFETWITFNCKMYVINPAMCAIITNIEEP